MPAKEAERLLAVAPEEFVEERKKLAHTLREEGRREEAAVVAALKKPTPVVLAVNRAARDRPQAARGATKAAERLGRAQLSGTSGQYQTLLAEMEQASSLLSEVALANLSKSKPASEATRRRVVGHIRGALATENSRALLARGALSDELEPRGFDALAGLPLPKRVAAKRDSESDLKKREREKVKQLRKRLGDLRREQAQAERRLADATRQRDELARETERVEAELRRSSEA